MSTIDEKLHSDFSKACDYVTEHVESLPVEALTCCYGFYKQATVGPCNTPKPSLFEMRAKKMWKSWSKLGSMSKDEAKRRYVQVLDGIVDDWRSSAVVSRGGWVRVSSPSQEEQIADSAKDVFDWVKEGDLQKIRPLSGVTAANLRDDCGLTLLHWAADRGHLDIVRFLISEMKVDVNCLDNDGQTPLHYAAACGYLEVCKFLVDSQAEVTAKDCQGLAPVDVADEASVRVLLGGLKVV